MFFTSRRTVRAKAVETVPGSLHGLTSSHCSTLDCFSNMISCTRRSLKIVSYCCNLSSTPEGRALIERLLRLAETARVTVLTDASSADVDSRLVGVGRLRYLKCDFSRLGCTLESSFWISDDRRFYLGSASLTGGSLCLVKEAGVYVEDGRLASDLARRFGDYLALARRGARRCCRCLCLRHSRFSARKRWMGCFLSDTPLRVLGPPRTGDEEALVAAIGAAGSRLDIELMNYVPVYSDASFCQALHGALMAAIVGRRVRVRVLVGHWRHTAPATLAFLRSLLPLNHGPFAVAVRAFRFPSGGDSLCDVNSARFLVADARHVHVSNGHLAGDRFDARVSASFNAEHVELANAFQAIFDRDWTSCYARDLDAK
ncbi:EEV envelope lipase [Saltwater crocodilepox virus]|nr:EEV envelope lipase [Saltwater crocodilepox virus]AVD69384.1 EEV envelope lipase [Saltwater crocodilepox virus]QGT46488.1 ORF049 [Saltwater crocodilepox virus]QGT46704.1 ORF049 [Saltwater crocodilepox virus]QGT46921.1 ORF049 [Saltwater crocodilepox virus]